MAFINVVKSKVPLVINKKNKPKVFTLRIGAKQGTCMLSPEFVASIGYEYNSVDFFVDPETKEFRFKLGMDLSTKIKNGCNFYIPIKAKRDINDKHTRYPESHYGYRGWCRSFYYELTLKDDGYWYGEYIGRHNPNK
ncbi:hypothetical protein CPT_Moabite_229 [Serratia phage Moabite]|uniref:Uncharacterized protein n=1 Tax=Serratia phage Moabite TaxID=2587814 RepID=A0A4Y5TQM4_9CAUD|nr:hypothetical protein HWC48_gp187 [Serratia phage Moabite]QDB71259.1 hypothetical protein CPT_Moabite_229 [Serratia phage Moabite]UGO54113.1 hypothetical protein HAYMO_131 [Serratia phage vB_SmaM_Haymo]